MNAVTQVGARGRAEHARPADARCSLVFAYFAWYPIGRAVVMSFQQTNLVTAPEWVGLENFRTVLEDPRFWTSVRNTAYFTLLALVFGYPLPLVLAVLMSELRRGKAAFSVLAYLPVVIPPVVAVLLWRFFYDASPTGVFNTMLGWVHLGPYPWIQDRVWAMPSLVLQATWANAGATVIIYLAALTGIRTELYDAAEVDGAGLWRKIWHVTLPQLRHILLITLILQIIATFQVFTEPFLMTGGGPQNATTTILLQIYDYAFRLRRLRGGDRAVAAAGAVPRRAVGRVLPADPLVEHDVSAPVQADELVPLVDEDAPRRARRRRAPPRPRGSDAARRGRRGRGRARILSHHDWRQPRLRWSMRGADTVAFVLLLVAGVGPILWLAKAATSTTQDTLRTPFALWPSGVDWTNLSDAWTKVEISKYFGNTLWVALGSWVVQLVVATTGGFVLSVLRPRYAKVVTAAVLATLFIPGIVVLVPLFLTVLDLPLFGTSLVDTYWAVWLPAGANAFNVLLVKRFMDGLPRDVFEAAQVDGAGPFRQLFLRRAAAVAADPRRRVAPGDAQRLEGLPLAAGRAARTPRSSRCPCGCPIIRDTVELDVFLAAHADLDGPADRAVPGVPAPVPARRQHRRRGEGLTAGHPPLARSTSRARVRAVSSGLVPTSTGTKSVVPASAKRPTAARTSSSLPTIDTPAGPSTPSRSITPRYEGRSL